MNDIENAEVRAQNVQQNYTLESLSIAIKSAPPPPREVTKKEALIELKKDLLAASKNGHTPASLVEVLRCAGLKVSQRAVANLVRESKPKTAASRITNTN